MPRNQSFVYHSSDHPMLQSPLPVQHSSSLEQLLLQLLERGRCLIRRRPRPASWDPSPGDTRPIDSISGKNKGSGTFGKPCRGSQSHRSRPVDLSTGSTHSCAARPAAGPRFRCAQGPCAPRPQLCARQSQLGGGPWHYINEPGSVTSLFEGGD